MKSVDILPYSHGSSLPVSGNHLWSCTHIGMPDCLAHTGLGCIKKLGSLADRACFCTHYKIFQLLQIQHIYSLSGENFSLFTSAFVLFLCFLIYIQRKSAKIPFHWLQDQCHSSFWNLHAPLPQRELLSLTPTRFLSSTLPYLPIKSSCVLSI